MFNFSTAAARLNREIQECETAIDAALERHSILLSSALHALGEVNGIDNSDAQKTLLRMNSAVDALLKARGESLRVHGDLLAFAREMGMTEEKDCPDHKVAHLKPVRAA